MKNSLNAKKNTTLLQRPYSLIVLQEPNLVEKVTTKDDTMVLEKIEGLSVL